MKEAVEWIVSTIGDLGYWGVFLMMLLESSFFPFPSEVVMIPAGYLIYQGEMNLFLALFSGTIGSLSGALVNYWIGCKMGRAFLLKYGKYVLFSPKSLMKMEEFFRKHGHISTFVGRLIPGVRQYISFPAGLCRMDLAKFCVFTSLGAMIWVVVLVWIGYSLGGLFADLDSKHLFESQASEWIGSQIKDWIFALLIFLVLILGFYIWKRKS